MLVECVSPGWSEIHRSGTNASNLNFASSVSRDQRSPRSANVFLRVFRVFRVFLVFVYLQPSGGFVRVISCGFVVPVCLRGETETTNPHEITRTKKEYESRIVSKSYRHFVRSVVRL